MVFEESEIIEHGGAIDPASKASIDFVITSRNDILSEDHTTRIAPIRKKKDNPKEETYALSEITAGVKKLGEEYNIPAITSLNGTLGPVVAEFMAQGRAIVDESLKSNCPFCYKNIFDSTMNPKIIHNLNIDSSGFPDVKEGEAQKKVISFPNKTPNGVIDYVSVFSDIRLCLLR